jgi:nifR3 family TIM-barrel protein
MQAGPFCPVRPIILGKTKIENNLFLAPMAGGSELPFRKICHRMGAGLVCTELVTARGIRYQKKIDKNYRYLEISPEEFPVAIQLFGSDPLDFETAVSLLFEHPLLSQCAMIDINMGCPVPKVIKTGAGSALMKNPQLAGEIIRACVRAAPVPVSVKFRKGFDEKSVNAVDFAKMCEHSGASLLTVHGRTTGQMYSGKADWNIIREVKESVGIPVIGNGDVVSVDSARAMFTQTGVDGVMIGRAALGNPWIFSELLDGLGERSSSEAERFIPPSLEARIDIMALHLESAVGQMGETTAMKEIRKHFGWYLKGVPGSSAVKVLLMRCTKMNEALFLLAEFKNKYRTGDIQFKKDLANNDKK